MPVEVRLPLLVTLPVRVSVPVFAKLPPRSALPIVKLPEFAAVPFDWLKLVIVRVAWFVNEPLDLLSVPIP